MSRLTIVTAMLVACTTVSSDPTHVTSAMPAASPRTTAPGASHLVFRPTKAALPVALQRSVAVWDGTIAYVAGGLDAAGTTVGGVYSIDPASGKVASLGSLAQPVHDAAASMIGGMIYVFAGGAGSGTETVQTFDPSTGTSRVVGHMPVALSDLASARIGTTTYLVGGYDGVRPRREIYATTDGTSFSRVGELPVGLRYPAVTVAGGVIVIAGGQGASGPTRGVYTFDPISGRTELLGELPVPLAHASAFTLGGVTYVAGGRDAADQALTVVSAIDPSTGRVKPRPSLARPVADAAVAAGSHATLLIGGWGTTTLRQVLLATLHPMAAT